MAIETHNPIEPAPTGPSEQVDELLLHRYLDGRLEMAECRAVEEMLRANAPARRRLDALREEERLIREALEPLAEPSRRLGDKVIAALQGEERSRLALLRTQRVRRHVFTALAAAASLLLCIWLIKPRDSVGSAASGTGATLQTLSGERRPLTKDTLFYEGDQIVTALGQFVRLRLSSGALLDLDEHSRLNVEQARPVPSFRLESGRLGVRAHESEVLVRLPQGSVRATAGSLVDVWLPRPAEAVWPEALEPAPGGAVRAAAPGVDLPAAVTAFSGTAYVANEKAPAGIGITAGSRALLWRHMRSIAPLAVEASRVLEARQGRTWHTLDGVTPQDRTVIGLLERPDFDDLNRRLNMAGNTSPAVAQAVAEALALLQDAAQTAAPAERAEKLATAQQALRLAYAPLRASDEHRAVGRLVEGLAHLERGRALIASAPAPSQPNMPVRPAGAAAPESVRTAATAAFDAARVAFEEALGVESGAALPAADAQCDWARQLAAGPSVTLRELSPANQAALLAAFHHAVARYWLARIASAPPPAGAAEPEKEAAEAAKEFDALRGALGRSVETLATRLAEGLALEAAAGSAETQAKALRGKAVEALEEVLAAPLAGWADASRRRGEGLRQVALLALVRAHLANQEPAQARAAAEDFRILYPLDTGGPVAREIAELLNADLLKQADAAFAAGHQQAAVMAYDEWLNRSAAFISANNAATLTARLNLLKALIALKNGPRARQEAAALAACIPPERKAELDALAGEAARLPQDPAKDRVLRAPADE